MKHQLKGAKMSKIRSWFSGKKTYIAAGIAAILGILDATGHPVPEWVYTLLGAFGLASLREAVTKSK